MDYTKLISGSDLRGVALEGYGSPVTMTRYVAASALHAFVNWIKREQELDMPVIAIGHDPRLSWQDLMTGALSGCKAAGAKPIDCGLCTTPAMFTACHIGPRADGAVMITASHLPKERNGLKFMTADGGLTTEQIREVVGGMRLLGDVRPVKPTERFFLAEYTEMIARFIAQGDERPLAGMRIVVDAGNGSGGFFASLLRDLGAMVDGLFIEPDGEFPNHIPNPEDPSAMEDLCDMVRDTGADLGVIFDADCDRAALCDTSGREINRNRLVALVADRILKKHPGSTIVTDSVTSNGVAEFIKVRGGKHRRFMRGYRNVIDEAMRLNENDVDCAVAIETSGHCAFRDNRFLDDGAYLVAWLLRDIAQARAKAEDWAGWIADLKEPVEDVEIRVKLTNEDFRADGEAVLAAVENAAGSDPALLLAQDSCEGVRFNCPEGGFVMVRLSVHDPVLPINIQSDQLGGAKSMGQRLLSILTPFAALIDLAPLADFCNKVPDAL